MADYQRLLISSGMAGGKKTFRLYGDSLSL
jgi:hypothetical protein